MRKKYSVCMTAFTAGKKERKRKLTKCCKSTWSQFVSRDKRIDISLSALLAFGLYKTYSITAASPNALYAVR